VNDCIFKSEIDKLTRRRNTHTHTLSLSLYFPLFVSLLSAERDKFDIKGRIGIWRDDTTAKTATRCNTLQHTATHCNTHVRDEQDIEDKIGI